MATGEVTNGKSADASAATRRCPRCGTAVPVPHRNTFCAACGQTLNESGARYAIVTGVACALVAVCGWIPFGLLGSTIRSFISPGSCAAFSARTPAMYLCSAKIAFFSLIGPISLSALCLIAFFLLRKSAAQPLMTGARRIPLGFRYLAGPVLATLFFTITWAGIHYGMAFRIGILPQIFFPAVVGLASWVVARYDFALRQRLSFIPLFDRRDKLSWPAKVSVVVLVPIVLSLALTFQNRVTAAALKEQLVVIATLVTAYLLHSAEYMRGKQKESTGGSGTNR